MQGESLPNATASRTFISGGGGGGRRKVEEKSFKHFYVTTAMDISGSGYTFELHFKINIDTRGIPKLDRLFQAIFLDRALP